MNIDKETIYKDADLARIEIGEHEVEDLQADMNKILTLLLIISKIVSFNSSALSSVIFSV